MNQESFGHAFNLRQDFLSLEMGDLDRVPGHQALRKIMETDLLDWLEFFPFV
jgi:hypothetical protein